MRLNCKNKIKSDQLLFGSDMGEVEFIEASINDESRAFRCGLWLCSFADRGGS